MTTFVKNNGAWVLPEVTYIRQNGVWVPVTRTWIKNNGIWTSYFVPTGSKEFTASGTLLVPDGVKLMYVTAIGGGGSAGNVVDGGRNDDYGGSGGGASGQKVTNYGIQVSPGETITVTIGAAGSRASGARDSSNQGGQGGTTYIYTASKTYYLTGGVGGYGGVGDAGNLFAGGTTPTTNTSFNAVTVTNGQQAQSGVGGYGGAGITGGNQAGGYQSGGNQINDYLNATAYGGGGAGIYSSYVREDNGNAPAWGGLGKAGYALFTW